MYLGDNENNNHNQRNPSTPQETQETPLMGKTSFTNVCSWREKYETLKVKEVLTDKLKR